MQLQITKDRYKSTNNIIDVNPETLAVSAKSYDWWNYIWTDSVGNIVFNYSKYSKTTSRHQDEANSILSRLNLKVSVYLYNITSNYNFASSAIKDEIEKLKKKIKGIDDEINRKGSHKRKNFERNAEIKSIEYIIKDLNRFLADGLNKKLMRIEETRPHWQYSEEYKETLKPHLAHLFLNHKGKIDVNALNEFVKKNRVPVGYNNDTARFSCPYTKLTELLSLKKTDIRRVICYGFSLDLERQLPEFGSDQWQKLVKFCDRKNINRETFNNYKLDMIHTWLTNAQNRIDLGPSEPRQEETFQYPQWVYAIKPDEKHTWKILDTPRKLRQEGKSQHHCIGGSNYIDHCRRDSMAFHLDGFTFFTDRVGNIKQTHGKYNADTPDNIETLFQELINAERDSNIVYLSERRA